MTDYQELYLKMFRASEAAIRLLEAAQQECEELYISSQNSPEGKILLIKEKTDGP